MATADPALRPEITSVLDRLRSRLRTYIVLEGVALVLVVIGVLFWLSFGLDWTWFQLTKLELPKWFRRIYVFAGGTLIGVGLALWVIARLAKKMRAKALALVLERKFPHLDDRLVTAVEMEESRTGTETDLTRLMQSRTIEDVSSEATSLSVGDVFNKFPLVRALTLAALLLASIGWFIANYGDAFDRWRRAFLSFDEVYWERETQLTAKVQVPPDDELKEFTGAVYKHPRGVDLDLRVFVVDGTKAPEEVELYYRKDNGQGEAELPMTKSGERLFRQKLPAVRDSLDFWITGGDFTNRIPYRVEVVDPPTVKETVVVADYPDYTGFDADPTRVKQRLRSFEHDLLVDTSFDLHLRANKPLDGAIVETGLYRLELPRGKQGTLSFMLPGDAEPTRVPLPSDWVSDRLPQSAPSSTFREEVGEKAAVSLPMHVVPRDEAITRLARWTPALGQPLPLPEDAQEPVRVFLHDEDDILSRDPYRLLVRGIPDEQPDVQTRLVAVRNKITRLAKVPVAGVVTDDLAIREVRFDWQSSEKDADDPNAADRWNSDPVAFPFTKSTKTYELGDSPDDVGPDLGDNLNEQTLRFDVVPLDLKVGQKLYLVVTAEDHKPQPGQGDVQEFEIVTKDELLGLIYQDELKQLQQFRDVIVKIQRVHDEFVANRTVMQEGVATRNQLLMLRELGANRTQEVDPDDPPEGADSGEEALSPEELQAKLDLTEKQLKRLNDLFLGTIEAGLHDVRTGSGDSLVVEKTLRELVMEMQNNQVDDPAVIQRMESKLFAPLTRINGTFEKTGPDDLGLFETVDRTIGVLKTKQEAVIDDPKAGSPEASLTDAVDDLDRLLAEMKRVLAEMEELIKYNNAIKTLQAILKAQEELKDATQKEQIKDLGGFDDLFN